MTYSLLGGLFVILCSIIGSIIGIFCKKISHRVNDMLLGFAAGIMLAAAFVSLLPDIFSDKSVFTIIIGISGIILGGVVLSLADRFVPHAHFDGEQILPSQTKSSKSKVILLVIAVAIHNLPEGLATGLVLFEGFNQASSTFLISMMLQKIPEGLIVAIPLMSMGMKKGKIFLYSCIVALMMLPGLLVGILVGVLPPLLIKAFMAFAFGAIIYVISDEIIPESHSHGHQKSATFSLLVGILCVVLISTLL